MGNITESSDTVRIIERKNKIKEPFMQQKKLLRSIDLMSSKGFITSQYHFATAISVLDKMLIKQRKSLLAFLSPEKNKLTFAWQRRLNDSHLSKSFFRVV